MPTLGLCMFLPTNFRDKKILAQSLRSSFNPIVQVIYYILWIISWNCSMIFFLPIFRTIITIFKCEYIINNYYLYVAKDTVCWQGYHLGLVFIAFYIIIFYFLYFVMRLVRVEGDISRTYESLRGDFSWFDWSNDKPQLQKSHFFSRQNNNFERFYVVLKALLVIITVLFALTFELIIALIIVSFLAVLALIRYPPYWNPQANKVRFGLSCGVLWTNLCALAVQLAYDPYAATIGYFLSVFVVVGLGFFLYPFLKQFRKTRSILIHDNPQSIITLKELKNIDNAIFSVPNIENAST